MLSLRLGTILASEIRWNADTLGISCCRGGEHSLLVVFEINHVATEIVFSLGADTLEFSI